MRNYLTSNWWKMEDPGLNSSNGVIASVPNLHVVLAPNPFDWLIPCFESTFNKWGDRSCREEG